MPKVLREDVDSLNSFLTVQVEKADYEPRFKSELNKHRDKAHLKGFRRGKTPMSAIKKMFGKSVLSEIINELFQTELFKYIDEEKLNILGQPLLADDQEQLEFDVKFLGDYELKFEIGMSPEFEVTGLDSSTYPYHKVELPDTMIEEQLTQTRERAGQMINPEEDIQENDTLVLEGKEMEGDAIKEDGVTGNFNILMSRVADEAVKTELLSKKKGDTLQVDIFKLEDLGTGEAAPADPVGFVKKYYLGLEADDEREINPMFEITISDVMRREIAELNQEFFDMAFGEGKVSSEEEAKDYIREDYQQHFDLQSDSLLYKTVIDDLIDKNALPLPDSFLKKWLKTTNENLSEKKIEEEYDKFARQMQWTLIRSKLTERFELEVEEEEMADKIKASLMPYLGQMQNIDNNLLNQFVERTLNDPNQYSKYHEEVISDKLQVALKEAVSLKEEVTDQESFEQLMQEAQEDNQAKSPNFQEEEE